MAATHPTQNLFVCGLHRSGTSLVTKAIAAHPDVASFKHTDAIEQEGQFLQAIFPTDQEFGGPGRFAFDPQAHLTEHSPLATKENAALLSAKWAEFHEPGRSVMVEKSPSNLLRTRLLQALFPQARFVILTRHPIPVALATQKWTHTSPFSLVAHWVQAHALLEQDLPYLRRVMILSYESFVADAAGTLDRIWQFAELPPHRAEIEAEDRNQTYFERWRNEFTQSRSIANQFGRFEQIWHRLRKKLKRATPEQQRLERLEFGRRSDAQDVVVAFEPAVRAFGYSLTDFSLAPNRDGPGTPMKLVPMPEYAVPPSLRFARWNEGSLLF